MNRGDIITRTITIIKLKRDVPSVILVDGHRYVLDPNTKTKEGKKCLHQNKKRV